MTTCARCRKEPATNELRFRYPLGTMTEGAMLCDACTLIEVSVVRDRATPVVVMADTRPEWQRRNLARDETGLPA